MRTCDKMNFVIGGAYQGKLDYTVKKYNLKNEEVFDCGTCAGDGTAGEPAGIEKVPEIDFSKKCIYRIEEFTYACVKCGVEPLDYFIEHEDEWQDSVLICEDIFCGVVPLGADMREWRQATGRLCKYLSNQAKSVIRIFCGLEQKLK